MDWLTKRNDGKASDLPQRRESGCEPVYVSAEATIVLSMKYAGDMTCVFGRTL
jgi:hypothetical protein